MHFDEFAVRVRLRNRTAFMLQALQMKLDGLPDQPHDLLLGFARRDAAGRSGTYAPKLSGPCSMTTM